MDILAGLDLAVPELGYLAAAAAEVRGDWACNCRKRYLALGTYQVYVYVYVIELVAVW